MITAFVTRQNKQWMVRLIMPHCSSIIYKLGDGRNVHAWARRVAQFSMATVIIWDSRVILSQRYRGHNGIRKKLREAAKVHRVFS